MKAGGTNKSGLSLSSYRKMSPGRGKPYALRQKGGAFQRNSGCQGLIETFYIEIPNAVEHGTMSGHMTYFWHALSPRHFSLDLLFLYYTHGFYLILLMDSTHGF